eukprot:3459421-Rhodomonas_salina.1
MHRTIGTLLPSLRGCWHLSTAAVALVLRNPLRQYRRRRSGCVWRSELLPADPVPVASVSVSGYQLRRYGRPDNGGGGRLVATHGISVPDTA